MIRRSVLALVLLAAWCLGAPWPPSRVAAAVLAASEQPADAPALRPAVFVEHVARLSRQPGGVPPLAVHPGWAAVMAAAATVLAAPMPVRRRRRVPARRSRPTRDDPS